MADIEHSALTDSDGLHEPKGVSGASIDQIYVATGTGTGAWKDSTISQHGDMLITNNATATAVVAAVDPTLNTDTDYVKVTAGWVAGHESGVTFSTDKLVAAVTGDYKFTFWASVKIPLNNNFIGFKYAINDTTPYSLQKLISQSATTNDYRNMFGSAIVTLNASDTVSVYIAGSKTDNLIVEEAGAQMLLIHAS
jgi:hypothetical protein